LSGPSGWRDDRHWSVRITHGLTAIDDSGTESQHDSGDQAVAAIRQAHKADLEGRLRRQHTQQHTGFDPRRISAEIEKVAAQSGEPPAKAGTEATHNDER
jgi:hypothetical protein